MVKRREGGLVYTTDGGRSCPGCSKPVAQCCCQKSLSTSGDGVVRVRRETKGRKGAGVTLVTGLALSEAEIKVLAAELKKKCGVGGAIKNGIIEIQGDNRIAVHKLLVAKGLAVKLAGG